VSKEQNYGVECKNPQCRHKIVVGTYLTSPEHYGDMITFVVVTKPGTFKCPLCKEVGKYDQDDIQEL